MADQRGSSDAQLLQSERKKRHPVASFMETVYFLRLVSMNNLCRTTAILPVTAWVKFLHEILSVTAVLLSWLTQIREVLLCPEVILGPVKGTDRAKCRLLKKNMMTLSGLLVCGLLQHSAAGSCHPTSKSSFFSVWFGKLVNIFKHFNKGLRFILSAS